MASGNPGMTRSRLSVAVLTALFSMTSISNTYSQSTGQSGSAQSTSTDSNKETAPLSNYRTNAIVQDVNAIRSECAGLEPEYRIDCLQQGLREVAKRMPQGGDYREARRAMERAVARLGRIQSANADTRAQRLRSRGNARFKLAKSYTAIKKANLKKAMEQARQVIDEAQTQLLRSSENSQKRSAHYQKIAVAVGSTKTLLRSA